MSGPDSRAAFRSERAAVLTFCDSLAPADWRMNSLAQGWSITDVMAHLASGCHALFSPQALKVMRSNDVEQTNDELVATRRDRTPAEVLAEYRRWSRLFGVVIPVAVRTSLGRLQMPLAELGRFRIITDVIGGFSYSADLSLFMQKALDFLDLNGSFYTVLQDVHSESVGNAPYYKDAPYLTEIRNADGSEVKVCSWLKSISCVEVSCEFKTGWKPPIETFHIRKICDEVKVPALIPVHFQAGTPPERRFLLAR